ncbi:hypothetical protein HPB47_018922 [Ixodes persulcatus]|uniref:Uncharacterized protein n=1 Tax=Ixodes persulcatus TaxID=34615 RepID=A0AC60R1D6_IXOPE|nr:hypothetical protein HPB47_018922 [Ixodes persulcatus]
MSIDMAEAQASTSTIIKDGYEIPPIDRTAETMSSSSSTILTKLSALPVRAFLPSDRTNCYGVLRDIDPDCREHDIKTRLQSTACITEVKRLGKTSPAVRKKPSYVLGVDNATTTSAKPTPAASIVMEITPPTHLILQWNCNGLKTRLPELRNHLGDNSYDAVALQEPRMTAGNMRIAGHVVYASKPHVARGVPRAALLVRRELPQSEVDLNDLCTDAAEFVAVTEEGRRRPLTIVSAYVAPNAPSDTHVLADIRVRAKGDLIVAGDFNAHSKPRGDKRDSSRGRELQATVEALDLRNITSGSQTFIRPGVTGSVIDLTFTTWSLRLSATPQADSWGSDHLPFIIGKPPKSPLRTCQIVDWDRYRTLLGEALERGFPFNSETLSRVLKEATREVRVPLTRPNPDLEWLKLRARRRRAQRKSWVTGKLEDILAYRRLDARLRKHGKKLVRRQWRLKCSTLDRPSGGSRAWGMSRTLAGRPIPRNPVLGMPVAMNLRPTEMVGLLADTFTEVPLVPTVGPPPENWDKHRTAPGPDGVTNQALRNVHESALPVMLALRNHVWRTAELPDAWRVATTIPLLKPGKPQDQLSSYRPTSLTSCLGKVMERMVLRRLMQSEISSAHMDEAKAQGWSAAAVFLDVRKAFDALPLNAIISALRRFGAGGAVSNPRKIIRGVPQGSVVSPLLFALAIASLPAAARVGEEPACPISMAVYADDVALWSTAPSYRRQCMVCALQQALTNTVYRLHQLGLAISAEKTTALCYAPKRPSKFMPTLRIGDTPVKLAKTATYLGVTLDSRLSWRPAMREVLQKMRTHTNILRMLGGTTWGTSSHMMLQLYRGLILSRPLHALPFATLSANQLKNLEQAQLVVLRICL